MQKYKTCGILSIRWRAYIRVALLCSEHKKTPLPLSAIWQIPGKGEIWDNYKAIINVSSCVLRVLSASVPALSAALPA